jgi:hypothetical protein
MKTYGGVDAHIHVFFTSAQVGGEFQLHVLAALSLANILPRACWIGGFLCSKVDLDEMEK